MVWFLILVYRETLSLKKKNAPSITTTENQCSSTEAKVLLAVKAFSSLFSCNFKQKVLPPVDKRIYHRYSLVGLFLLVFPPSFLWCHFLFGYFGKEFPVLIFIDKLPCSQSHIWTAAAVVVIICWTVLFFEMIHSKALKHSEQDVWLTLQTAASWGRKQAPQSDWGEMKAILASWCLCVCFQPLPFLSTLSQTASVHRGKKHFPKGKALSKVCSPKEQCAFCCLLNTCSPVS